MLTYVRTAILKKTNLTATGSTQSLPASVFVKPFMLATLAAVLMPLFIGFILSLVSDALLARHQTSNRPASATEHFSYRLQARPEAVAFAEELPAVH